MKRFFAWVKSRPLAIRRRVEARRWAKRGTFRFAGVRASRRQVRTLVQVSETARIEYGPVRKVAQATEATLSDQVTAPHYFAGVRTVAGRKLQGVDAAGKVIEKGQPMEYLDYYGTWAWHVYRLEKGRYREIGCVKDDHNGSRKKALEMARGVPE